MSAYFTKQALKKLKEKISYLEKIERKKIEQDLKQAIAFGDLSENTAYVSAREEQELLEKQIIKLKKDLKNAIIIKPKKTSIVQLNSIIWLEKINKNQSSNSPNNKIKITLCSPNETDPLKNKISTNSPLGMALFGKTQGKIVSIKINDKIVKYKINKIE